MSPKQKQPAIVAELGRPETAEETAARKAEDSRKHRSKQTSTNLWLSLLATLAIAVVLVLLVPRSDSPADPDIDYTALAVDAQEAVDAPLAVPVLPDGWKANAAELRTSTTGGVTSWYVGFITPERDFLAYSQGVDGNSTWLANLLDDHRVTGQTTIGGQQWDVYDDRDDSDAGNLEYALATDVDGQFYAVYGTAEDAEFTTLATALAEQIGAP
ncbi:DUF4245 domain-containing protein [Naasia lichenicola]|uniref:DUF4245 domain-containing protein n=1 Tax=Naasia lichenicola TaxID=2565933 RepID=A0A4S4FE74_9MICO|nr:DUF4245 domain-containing protein [Naasia lichenicola]THG28429.1 DUF4245 domain-containing protein [Naasia lichenicola]